MPAAIRRILLVWPRFEVSFWGMQTSLHRVGKKAVMSPLALITVAGMLPREKYDFRHIDLNYQDLDPADIEWADLVMLSGWGPQLHSILRSARACRKGGKKVFIGGPLASECPELLRSIDYIFRGEAEGTDLDAILDDIRNDKAPHILDGVRLPNISTEAVLPRFDLLDLNAYWQVTVQYGRGCPFTCEFCDIIELYGRIPRTKDAGHMVRELEALKEQGYRGPLFFVDDNFYGNRKSIENILPSLTDFQRRHDFPFHLHTEASINLAQNEELLVRMRDAGFYSMFTGIETPSNEALREAKKVQNLKLDLVEAIDILQGHELYVQAGFIMGFDSDPDGIDDIICDYVETTGITIAMTGLLVALPHTQLEKRLVKEGRMMETANIDQFGLPNFITKTHPSRLLSQYEHLVSRCFEADALDVRLQRQQKRLEQANPRKRDIATRELAFYAEHLQTYGQRVSGEISRVRQGERFERYSTAHEEYWGDSARGASDDIAKDAKTLVERPA